MERIQPDWVKLDIQPGWDLADTGNKYGLNRTTCPACVGCMALVPYLPHGKLSQGWPDCTPAMDSDRSRNLRNRLIEPEYW